MEYLLLVDGVQEDLTAANTAADDWSCTPVTDYWSYANRLWVVGSGDVTNTYGTCGDCPSGDVSGCTDASAINFNSSATVDDGSCEYASAALTITTTVCDAASSVRLTGPWWNWDPNGGPEAVDNGDGTWTFTLDPAPTADMEYLLLVDGVQEDLTAANTAADDWSCTPVTDYWSYANRLWVVGSGDVTNTYGTCGDCPSGDVSGCTDASAINFNSEATVDDGSCEYASAALTITTTVCDAASSVRLTGPWWNWDPNGGPEAVDNGDGTWTFTLDPAPTADMEYLLLVDGVQEDLTAANTAADDWSCTPVTDYWSYANRLWVVGSGDVTNTYGTCGPDCPSGGVSGCTDASAENFNSEATVDDGSCTYPSVSTTFNVDMNCAGVAFSTVHLTGPIWGWTTDIVMTDDNGDGIYSVTIDGLSGDVEYKYMVDYWANQENLVDDMQNGATCAPVTDYAGFANRLVAAGSDINDTYGICGSCEDMPEPPVAGASTYCGTQTYHFMNEAEVPSSIFISVGNNGPNSIMIQVESADGDPIDDLIINSATGGYALGTMSSVAGAFSNTMTWDSDVNTVDINVLWSKASFGGNWQWSQSNVTINVNDTCDISTPTVVSGCTDASAINYNSEANTDDGSCTYPEPEGYAVTISVNTASISVGPNGIYAGGGVLGDAMAVQLFDEDGDGIWTGVTYINPGTTGNYILLNSPVNGGDWGAKENLAGLSCADPANWNDRILPAINSDTTLLHCFGTCETDGQCPAVEGCTDASASNYDPAASVDDGSCEFLAEGESPYCYTQAYHFMNEAEVPSSIFISVGNNGPNSIIIQVESADGDPIDDLIINSATGGYALGTMSSSAGVFSNTMTWDSDVNTVDINILWSKASFGGNWQWSQSNVTINVNDTCDISTPTIILGCTDPIASNYNSEATSEDGSCEYTSGPSPYCNTQTYHFMNEAEVPSSIFISVGNNGANSIFVEVVSADADPIDDLIINSATGGYALGTLTSVDGVFSNTMTWDSDVNTVDINVLWSKASFGGNWQWSQNNITINVNNTCESTIAPPTMGCTDPSAENFNSEATVDDGSCTYPSVSTTFNVDMNCAGIAFTTVHLTGPIWGWTTDIVMTDDNGDGIYSVTIDGLSGDVEYKYMVDYWANQENLVDDMQNGATCAPVTDYAGFANRLVAAGSDINDTYGTCGDCPSGDVSGCTDASAINFNSEATVDDGSCEYASAALTITTTVCDAASSVRLTGPWWNWDPNGGPEAVDNGDGTWTFTLDPAPTAYMEYLLIVDGVQEDLTAANTATDDWSCTPVTDYWSYANRLWVVGSGDVTNTYGTCGECAVDVLGCTDPAADNFDPVANTDDGSCTFCSDFSAVLTASSDVSESGASDGYVQATGQGGSSNYDVQVFDANGAQQNPFALAAGDYTVVVTDVNNDCSDELVVTIGEPAVAVDPCDITPSGLFVDNIIHNRVVFNWSAPAEAPSYYMIRYRPVGTTQWTVMRAGPETPNAFTGTSRTRYFHEAATTYEWSMRARMVDEDLATICQSPWSASAEYTTLPQCANLENLAVDNVEANWVTFLADAPDASWGVWQSKGKMREVGTNAYRYVNGGSDGTIAGVLKGNFTASTDYEWHTKAWCTANVDENGNPDPMYHSGWGDFSAFTTEAPCDKLPTNLTTSSNGANTAVIMSWDTPESGAPDHYFLEMTNLTTGAVYEWNYQDGESNSRTKFGQNPGDEISWRIRGACGSNGTSWATIFTQPVTYTLGGARLASEVVSQLDVYPNPSRDIFNVTFTSEEAQTLSVKVVNMIGEEIYTEELTDFVGQYSKVVDMNTQPKGVYFLEITTNNGAINQKIVLQ